MGAGQGYSFLEITPANIGADSHFRYMSGLLLGVGLCFWSTVPDILNKTGRFQLLTMIVVIGGLCRLYSYIIYGFPGFPMLGGLIMELVIVPLLCLWQGYLAKAKYNNS